MPQRTWSRRLHAVLIQPPWMLGADFGPRYSPRAASGGRRATEDGALRTFFERSTDPMLLLDENHVILDANLAATHFLECPLEALRGAPVLDIDPLAQMLTAGGTLARVRTEESPVVHDVGITNSEDQPVQCRIQAVACDGGRTLLHLQDTTAVLRARSALRSAMHLHQAWFAALPAVAWTMALPEERLLEIGPTVETLFGYQPAEFRAKPELWSELVHPADRERVRAEFRRGVATGRPFEIAFTGLHRDHRDLPYLVNRVIPMADEQGWVEHCEGFIEDRSALHALEDTHRREESHLRHVLHAVPVGVMIVEEAHGGALVALCNARWAQLLRLGEPPAPGTPLVALPEEVRRLAGDGGHSGVTRPAEGPLEDVFELQSPHRVLRRSVVATRDPFGSVTGWVVAIEDITSPWITRRRFVHAQKMESLTRLAGGIAHDFNNLLGTVAGFASLIADRTTADDPRREAADGILSHIARASRLTQALQTFGRTARFERIELDVNRVVDSAYPLLRAGLDSGVTVEVELGVGLPRVHGDPVLMQQLVVQLVQDAGLMLGAGDTVRIATRLVAEETVAKVAIEVTRLVQSGAGPEAAAREDGEFGRAAIEDILRAHGGRLLTGTAAAPASCRVLLPVRGALPLAVLNQDEEPCEGAETILLVEDEADLSSVTRIGLEQRGYSVVAAPSGERALELLRSEGFACDLVILDLRLPGIPGEKVLEELRDVAPDLPVLIATGDAHTSRDSWIAAGADGYLAKPYRLRDLATTVRDILDARRKAA